MSNAATYDADIAQLREVVRHQQVEIDHLKLIIARLKRRQFGRRSEQIGASEQMAFVLAELHEQSAPIETPPAPPRDARSPRRRPLPAHLPREIQTHLPPEGCCPECGSGLTHLGDDVSEMLEYIPARFKVIRHVRPKLACRRCDTIVQAAAPDRPIPKGIAGAGLLTHVLISKYCDHLPLYRQSAIFAREGIDLDRATLSGWVAHMGRLLTPVAEALRQHVLSGTKIHADDTPIPVLEPGRGQTRTGRMWTYVRDGRASGEETPAAVWFAYSPDRKGCRPTEHLKGFKGHLQADGYAGFNALYASGDVHEVACWAHVRRKFHDIEQSAPGPVSSEVLLRIAELYGIEKSIRGSPPELRRSCRQQHALPRIESLRQWFEDILLQISAKSELAGAIRYALHRWQALVAYIEHGALEIDNNPAERSLRAIALGRKNYLFAGSDAGGERAAAIYSLLGSAQMNGYNPVQYLQTLIECVGSHPINKVHELLPWNLQCAHNPLEKAA
jgi:transposase